MKALVVGGAGVTGTVIVRGLLERGYQVTILHRGVHEPDLPESVERIHANPYDKEELPKALQDKQYDIAIATYGRLRYVLKALKGKTERLISVGGAAPIYKGWGDMMATNPWETTHLTPLFLAEDHPLASAETEDRFSQAVRFTEQEVLTAHQEGIFNITHFRYPLVYGPNNICPAEWGLIRRMKENRKPLIMPARGLGIVSRGYAENIAHGLMLAVDNPKDSAGEIYNICDNQLLHNHEWIDLVSRILNYSFDTIDIPFDWLPKGFRATPPQLLYRDHCVMDISKIKQQLGYKDLVTVEQAVEKTIHWYLANPVPAGGEPEQNLGDPFDYAYEDALIAAYKRHSRQFASDVETLPKVKVVWRHPYQ